MTGYDCDRCGACCRGHLLVEVYELDVLREPLLLSADTGTWCRGKTPAQLLEHLQQEGTALLIAGPKPCTFLGADNRCGIYPTRPNDCVAMQAGDEQCQLARAAAGLPPLSPCSSAC